MTEALSQELPPWTDADQAEATELLMELLALPGPSGEEGEVADYIAKRLRQAAIEGAQIESDEAHRQSTLGGSRGNLICKLPGRTTHPRRLISAHMDTVPICSGAVPRRDGDQIVPESKATGLGGDNRAGCAVLLTAARFLARHDLPYPPVTFLWTVQEEVGLHGARHASLAALGTPAMGFNFDGSLPSALTIGATGGYRMQIVVQGIASHAGVHPERGVSAIAVAAQAITELVEGGWHGLIDKHGQQGTSNIGVIRGGQATNVVAEHVELRAEARSHDASFRETIVREIEQAFQRAAERTMNEAGEHGSVSIDGRLDYDSFLLDRKEPCVEIAAQAVAAEGLPVDYRIASGGLDANWLTARGIPTVSLGCGQRNIHTTAETLDLEQFGQACRLAIRLATGVA